ncbi:hypothetical protein [Nonomuraea dietziae]|uniref:hypothetical protein n=1 Tax=Nonomuraea dietziae TaxID=65515 RepID=UPI0034013FE3
MSSPGSQGRESQAGEDQAREGQAGGGHGGDGQVRERLEQAQARVVAALVNGAEPPPGFDPVRLAAQARSLLAKRRAIVARLRPDAAAAAGKDLATEFAAYAAARSAPPPGYRADADDFAAWLRARGRLAEPSPQSSTEPSSRAWRRLLPRRLRSLGGVVRGREVR